jgi:hypothetical protein
LQVIRWQAPWPLIPISGCEWAVMRDHPSKPAALVRYLEDKGEERYRMARWQQDPADRRLFVYFSTPEMADMAVRVMESEPHTGRQAITTECSPEWGRFERWFWPQTREALVRDFLPA